jgi:hydroxyacylglutathione hydrolase
MIKHSSLSLQVIKYTVGEMSVNCYFIIDNTTKAALIIDPGDGADYLSGEVEKLQIHPIGVIATHGHFDHILAALELQLIYNIPFRMHSADTFLLERMRDSAEHFLGRKIVELPPKLTEGLYEGENLSFGNSTLTVINTPGHTPGGVSLYAKDFGIFVGDTLFDSGGIGRTDFTYSNSENLQNSINKILDLPDTIRIFSGHGEDTWIEKEKPYHQTKMYSR